METDNRKKWKTHAKGKNDQLPYLSAWRSWLRCTVTEALENILHVKTYTTGKKGTNCHSVTALQLSFGWDEDNCSSDSQD